MDEGVLLLYAMQAVNNARTHVYQLRHIIRSGSIVITWQCFILTFGSKRTLVVLDRYPVVIIDRDGLRYSGVGWGSRGDFKIRKASSINGQIYPGAQTVTLSVSLSP